MASARASIIRIGDLGRSPAPPREIRLTEDADSVGAEHRAWRARYGWDWVEALHDLARWAREIGLPIRAGSRALARSPLALQWGWGGLPEGVGNLLGPAGATPPSPSERGRWPERPSRPTWVLRTAPGWAERVRRRVEEDARLDARGAAPYLVLEETPRAFLPHQPHAEAWPEPEAWCRATRLLAVGGRAPLTPSDWEDLFAKLRQGAVGRHPLEEEQAWLGAWDLWCAASAWERDRAAWWMTRFAAGFVSHGEQQRWVRRASDWRLRILPPSVEASRVCPRREGGDIRLGLERHSRRVREIAPELVRERLRGGSFGSASELLQRGTRIGAGWLVVAELALTGALSDLRGGVGSTALGIARSRWSEARRAAAPPVGSRAAFSG